MSISFEAYLQLSYHDPKRTDSNHPLGKLATLRFYSRYEVLTVAGHQRAAAPDALSAMASWLHILCRVF